ncbi:MAG TPA: hypothetical protein DCZ91_14395 [Lachnospiraceae bacterium]|nr:hypothetical protein [Lachnospiraceae bacterium]
MKICIIDGAAITDKNRLHDVLSESLQLPDWYGRNLDALYDCLTDMQEVTEVHILQVSALESNLGRYAKAFLKMLGEVSEDNTAVKLIIEEKM